MSVQTNDQEPRYAAEVVVKPGTIDAVFVLYDEERVIARWKILCGNEGRKDPKRMGGRTPHIVWRMNAMYGKIDKQRHPTSKKTWFWGMIEPAYEEDKADYPNRTWAPTNWPFMMHAGGSRTKSSTGCLTWPKRMWAASRYINRAFAECGQNFLIDCFESQEAYDEELEALAGARWYEG